MTLSIFVMSFYFAKITRAADGDLIITEIMYDPDGTDTGKEWIEIFNSGTSEVKIKSGTCSTNCWRFIDQFAYGLPSSSHRHTFSEDATLKPGDFFIIANDKDKFKESYPDYTGIVIKSSFSLPNENSTLAFSSDGGKNYFSKIEYAKSWGGSGNGKTLEKIDFASTNDKINWQESFIFSGTPGTTSSTKQIYSTEIAISELLPNPSLDEEKNEFIELHNFSSQDIELENWTLEDKSGSCFRFSKTLIKSGEYLVVYRNDFKFALNNTGSEEVTLKNPNGDIVSHASYSESAKENFSYALDDQKYSWTSTPTPGRENVITISEETKPAEENLSSAEKIYLNEILANPKGDERSGEFIELVSHESDPVDLYGFMVRDGSKTGKYIFKEHIVLEPSNYFVIYRPQSKVALNNTKESVSLYNPQGKSISSVSYDKSAENVSYNFDGKNWKWSKFLTPGARNKFDSPPKLKIGKVKTAYRNTYVKFSAVAKDRETKKLKYVWDFGDGHKSYLKNTSHKYLKTRKYLVRLTVRDASQAIEKNFRVMIKKYPHPKIEIIKAIPNPQGLDSQNETVTLKNSSEKEVNLLDYKIATGSVILANHPISTDITIKPGEEKVVTRADSKIVLNNKAGRIALLYPDGKLADEIQYSKEKIEDNEAFAKIDGEWRWIAANIPDAENEDKIAMQDTEQQESQTTEQPSVLGTSDENISMDYAPRKSIFNPEDAFIFLSQIGFLKSEEKKQNYCPLNPINSLIEYLFISPL